MDPASGLLVFAFHSTVIKTPRATILVDTCSGNDKERPHKLRYHRKNWSYLANLAAAGFMPEDIDYVLCSHLHADHVGWNTRLVGGRWVPTFPNARYLFARREWEHWREAELRAPYTTDPYYEDSLLPVMDSGQAELVATGPQPSDDLSCVVEPTRMGVAGGERAIWLRVAWILLDREEQFWDGLVEASAE
jgi:glyoxylase-like metal-dependent hydrolase (beta-lactamase superfamily II)